MNGYGKVIIAGAGPGDPGLITIKCREAIEKADVILYDRLINISILDYAKPGCLKMFVGKEASRHYVPQDETNKLLIEFAKSGKNTLRLKGGDPLIFGRGSEEAMALLEEGIEFEFIPGITAGIGGSAYSGIPLTHRGITTQFIFLTAHESPDKPESQIEWELIARMKNTTILIYMGASLLDKIAQKLLDCGMAPEMPAAIVENATLPAMRTTISDVGELAENLDSFHFNPPLITIISPTVPLRKYLAWFEKRPLFGKRIVVTRAASQAKPLYKMLEERGAVVIPFQVLRIEQYEPDISAKRILSDNQYDWLIFSSENGVKYFFERLNAESLDARALAGMKIAVVGKGTAAELSNFGIKADFIPSGFTSQRLISELSMTFHLEAQKILRIKGDFGNDFIADELTRLGATVMPYIVYRTLHDRPDNQIIEDLLSKGCDTAMFTSGSSVDSFFAAVGEDYALNILKKSRVIAIGPVTGDKLDSKGINNYLKPDESTVEAMVDLAVEIFSI
ncbi:MAG: uroporphyrinogen methyltransferase / synthase [Bacteroidota bacterium]|nr:uroporphyrinogen methyltransferase / synthase [Bacteroidota bacterium]